MSEKTCGEIIKQTLQTLQMLQTRRTQIPRKISFTRITSNLQGTKPLISDRPEGSAKGDRTIL
ncbi:MAG: hypothetical protein F6K58_26620 [Symploca sp. SIO2E9]|nr:hypothetical protein [Symploca sp. SIO2E9]